MSADDELTQVAPGEGAPTPPEELRLAQDPRRRLARFVVVDELGRGGMGVVLRAFDPAVGRKVAIKLLIDPSAAKPETLARFRREVEAAGKLQHPGIVSILEAGEHAGQPYLVTELVDGESFGALLTRGALTRRRAVEVVRDVARALAYAHAQGVLHRDVKPANILVDRAGRARLIDFGLARLGPSQLTRTGEVLGTPSYMAPEQAGDSPSRHGPAMDVYSLGAVLYRALTGRPPVEGTSLPSMLKQLLTDAPKPPRELDPTIEPELEATTLHCLAKEPEGRPAAATLADRLDAWLAPAPSVAPPPTKTATTKIAAAFLVGVGLMTGLWIATRPAPAPVTVSDPAAIASPSPAVAVAPPDEPTLPPAFQRVNASSDGTLRLAGIIGARGRRHAEGLKSVAFSADGRLALTADGRWDAGTRGFLHVWDVATVSELRAWPAHWGWPVAALSPDGRLAVSGSRGEGFVCVWDVDTGRELTRQGAADEADVRTVQLLPDGRSALIARKDGRLTRLALEEGAREQDVARLPSPLLAAAPLPSGDQALVLADGKRALVDLETGAVREVAADLRSSSGQWSPWGLVVRADGMHLRWGDDGQVGVWREPSATQAAWTTVGAFGSAAWVPGGDRALLGHSDASIYEWRDGHLAPVARADSAVWALAADARGRALIGTELRTLSLFEFGTDLWGLDPAWSPAVSIATTPGRVVVGFEDGDKRGTTRVFDLESGDVRATIREGMEWMLGVGARGDRVLVVGSNGSSRNVSLWRVAGDQQESLWSKHAQYPNARGDLHRQTAGALSPDGRMALTAGEEGTIQRWDEPDWEPHPVAQQAGCAVVSLAFDRDEPARKAFAACTELATRPRFGRLFEVTLDQPLQNPALELPGGPCVVASLSGGRAVAGCLDGRVLSWRPGDDEATSWPEAHERAVRGVAVSPDGSRVATCGADSLIILWDARRRRRLAHVDLSPVADVGRCLAFTSDRELIVGTSRGLLLRFAVAP